MKKQPLGETLLITDISADGVGVGRLADGKVCFVPGTVIGDSVTADAIKITAGYNVCRLTELVSPSQSRIEGCPLTKRCGGCVFSEMNYADELEYKQRRVERELRALDVRVMPIEYGSPDYYRNKVAYPVGITASGKLGFGYYAPHSHDIVFHDACALQDASFCRVANVFLTIAESLKMTAYDGRTGKGLLRHLLMRRNSKGEISLCVVINASSLQGAEEIGKSLANASPETVAFSYNINTENTNVITGKKTVAVYGSSLRETLCGKDFTLSPLSFFQVNRDMAERLYYKSKEYAALDENGVLLDLYCGIGSIGLSIVGAENGLCGVETVESAVNDAKINALINGRSEKNTLFVAGDASIGVAECTSKLGKPDVIVVDPPRKGLYRAVIDSIAETAVERIVYISCNPATLARDLAIFSESGYICREATPFDLFPRTAHVETVVWMSREKGN